MRNLMLITKNKYWLLYIVFMSVLFALSFYVANFIFPSGDQTWFREYAQQYHFHYLYFGWERYFTWSSRLFIESLTMFLSVHEYIFPYLSFFATLLLLSVSRYLSPAHPFIPAVLLFIFFPITVFVGAGPIPTYINYVFPVSLLVFALYYRQNSNVFIRVISLLLFVFSIMQEQLAVYAFLWFLGTLYKESRINRISKWSVLYAVISFIGVISVLFAPGNMLRIEQEIANWFPTFHDLNILQKITLGILETGHTTLMISKTSVFAVGFICILFLVAMVKRKYFSLALTTIVGFMMFMTRMNLQSPLNLFFSISTEVKEAQSIILNSVSMSAVAGYFIVFLLLFVALYMVTDKEYRFWILYLFFIGISGRMMVSFSPTIYASGSRTMLPLTLSLYIISCHLIDDIWIKWK